MSSFTRIGFTRRASVAAAVSSILAFPSFAADRLAADEIVVTAARLEQPLSHVIGSTSVITREDIQRRQVHSVQDLLRGATGLSVVNNGGLGKLSNVFVRGADAEQVLVLIDGVRAGSATSGTTAFEYLPVDQIERIEIVRGPRSSIYGADAIGGVIQIFTRRAQGPAFSVGAGSNETYNANASFGASSDRAWLNVSGNHLQSEGFNSCIGAPFPPGGGCFTYEPDRDGYDNTSGVVRTGYRWGSFADIEASALYAAGLNEYDGDFANETEFTSEVLTLRGRVRPTDAWDLKLTVGQSSDLQDNFYDDPLDAAGGLGAGEFDTTKRSASLQSDWAITQAQTLSVGVDYLDDIVQSTTAYAATSRDNVGVFGQYQAQLGAHQALVSARYDDNEQFGGHGTGGVGWKWALSDRLALTAAWGSAFGAPTFNDLYFPGFSNPDLEPEESSNYEVGLLGRTSALRWSLAAFENRVEQLIVYDAGIFAPNNLNEARIRGVETEANAAIGEWTLTMSYMWLDPRNRSAGADYGAYLPRRARQTGHVEVGRAFGPVDARVRLTAEGARYDNVANTVRLSGYTVVDFAFDYALNAQWTLQGKLANALDRNYQTVRLYNQDDRALFVTLRYQPEAQ
ncbi:MAG: TonB-dependent receptor domain-containing protein [Steroidobacter sp.]